jgi:hypothetical protein
MSSGTGFKFLEIACFGKCFSMFDAFIYRGVFKLLPSAKFSQAYCFSVQFDQDCVFLFSCLFLKSSPSAILRRVITVIVDSINSVVEWWVTHVTIEGFETSSPFMAHFYSPPSIVFELPIFLVVASSDYSAPNHVNSRASHSVELSAPSQSIHSENCTSELEGCHAF